mmetsp:Transcript_27131/g.67176  ORF Transcript_27131/g.67176 Transcript_27131/m.67176 type:complete len:98 (+) Transcript_27131:413-706(+)
MRGEFCARPCACVMMPSSLSSNDDELACGHQHSRCEPLRRAIANAHRQAAQVARLTHDDTHLSGRGRHRASQAFQLLLLIKVTSVARAGGLNVLPTA